MWFPNVANSLNPSNSPSANILFKIPDLFDSNSKNQNANISGEKYIRTLAHYIHANERRLTTSTQLSPPPSGHRRADSSGNGSFSISNLWSISTALTSNILISGSTPPSAQIPSPAGSNSSYQKSSIFVTLDHHHLYYLLTKFGEYGLDVGSFEYESKLDGLESNVNNDKGDASNSNSKDGLETASITSATSINSISSAMSSISLISGWHGWSMAAQTEEVPIEDDIRYIYRSFLKLSGLRLAVVPHTKIEGSESWPLLGSMLSLTPFKNLSQLEICKLSIKIIDGWDILQEKLESLTIQNGSIDDITELFVDAVVASMKRRKIKKNKKIMETDEEESTNKNNNSISESESTKTLQETKDDDQDPTSILPAKIWPRLTYINLSENSLTFIANEPVSFITTCTHLDLSHNLLIAVPTALSQLYNLQYLNLSYNMIESVVGIYNILVNVTKLDLRNNRVENLCGLERVITLEWVDVRENRLTDWAEIGRMTVVPGIREIYVEGNPLTYLQTNYRVNIFTEYKKNNLDILLDGYGPSMKENRKINVPTKQPEELQRVPTASLSRVMSIEQLQTSPKNGATPSIDIPILKKSRKKRIVDPLDNADELLPNNKNGAEGIVVRHKSGAGKKKKEPVLSSSPPASSEISDQKRHVHRNIKVEKAYAHDVDPKVRDLRKRKSSKNIRSKTLDTPPRSPALSPSAQSDSEVASLSGSPKISLIGEGFRNRMEKLRNEGGAAWLKVFNEMEYSTTGEGNKLREPKVHDNKDTKKHQSNNVNS
ncbi:2200_t:CDS:2 [Ambispora leptoticha]|uniref:2200_t:CDS:1 n=1 Tax=Ambispora leptoticha TaxID=144679 RepID=A0A9N9FDZ4_9GLOM|nr:2200_t:CDS:2 [Ambispora leptoticha]